MEDYVYKRSEQEVIDALTQAGGIILAASKTLGLKSPGSLRTRIKNNPALSELLDELRENVKDKAEKNIYKAIEAEDVETSKWYLARMGQDRGYGNKFDISGTLKVQPKYDLSNLTGEELEQLEQLLTKSETASLPDSGGSGDMQEGFA